MLRAEIPPELIRFRELGTDVASNVLNSKLTIRGKPPISRPAQLIFGVLVFADVKGFSSNSWRVAIQRIEDPSEKFDKDTIGPLVQRWNSSTWTMGPRFEVSAPVLP